jgi:hypothetical protein
MSQKASAQRTTKKLKNNIKPDFFKGYAVVQLVEALCYKLEGCEFDSQCGLYDLSSTESF